MSGNGYSLLLCQHLLSKFYICAPTTLCSSTNGYKREANTERWKNIYDPVGLLGLFRVQSYDWYWSLVRPGVKYEVDYTYITSSRSPASPTSLCRAPRWNRSGNWFNPDAGVLGRYYCLRYVLHIVAVAWSRGGR